MRKFLMLLLALALALTACGGNREMIGQEKAIEIAFPVAVEAADGPITRDMAACEIVDGCYQVTFDGKTENILGISTIVIVRVDAYSGEIVDVMEAA